jgi:hypothetical protein
LNPNTQLVRHISGSAQSQQYILPSQPNRTLTIQIDNLAHHSGFRPRVTLYSEGGSIIRSIPISQPSGILSIRTTSLQGSRLLLHVEDEALMRTGQAFELPQSQDDPSVEWQAADFLERLFMAIADAVHQLTAQERLVFTILYVVGLAPSRVADYLGLSRARISQCIASIHRRITEQAAGLISRLAEATDVGEETLREYLRGLLEHLRKSEQSYSYRPYMLNSASVTKGSFGAP